MLVIFLFSGKIKYALQKKFMPEESMITPVPELNQRKRTDKHLSFAAYVITILILTGILLTLTILMGMHWVWYFFRSQGYYFNYRFSFPPSSYFLYMTGWMLALIIGALILSIVFWWYQWQLYKRRNEHIERIKSLKKSLIHWLKEKHGIDFHPWSGGEIQLSIREKTRSTSFFALWVVFSYLLIPVGIVLTLVAWYWLTIDYYVHEKGEIQFFYQLSEKLKEKNLSFHPAPLQLLPPRNMVLYIILMIIPGVNLVWALWWSYVLFQDPNVHFETHKFWEGQLEKIVHEPKTSDSISSESPLEILKRRYAEGKITREQFQQMKEDLEK